MRGPFSPERLIGVCAPLILWALHLVIVYSVQGLACSGQMDGAWWQRRLPVQAALIVLTLLMLAIVAWQGWRAQRLRWHCVRPSRAGFLASATLLTSVLAAIAIVFTTAPILMLTPCE